MSYEALLYTLRRGPGDVRALIDELEDLLAREPPDETMRRELAAALAARAIEVRGLATVWRPGLGEGYVLLAGAAGGRVGRVSVRRAGPPHGLGVRSQDGATLGGRAMGQLHLALSVLAERLARRGVGVPQAGQRGHEIVVSRAGAEMDGSSLGAAFAAAVVSRWTEKAPSPEVAATAALDSDGGLVAVDELAAKLTALVAAYPAVRRVVVAIGQEPVDAAEIAGVALLRRATIEDVLAELELSLDDVVGTLLSSSQAEAQVRALPYVHVASYDAAAWRQQAVCARLLAVHPKLAEEDGLTARAFAALFHLHAGDDEEAGALVSSIPEPAILELPASGRVWARIIKATSAIDSGRHDEARERAQCAVEEARSLGRAERRDLVGRALGTLGRALMHAGEDDAALPYLREAAEHHEAEVPREAARSWNTLAMALRRAGLHEDAFDALEHARRAIAEEPDEGGAFTSTLFLEYERGRVLYELDRWEEARAAFELVVLQQREGAYPSVGCLRYLAGIDASRGDDRRAREWLEQALAIAEGNGGIIGKIAASAAMALLTSADDGVVDLRARASHAWAARFGEVLTDEAARRVLRGLVY